MGLSIFVLLVLVVLSVESIDRRFVSEQDEGLMAVFLVYQKKSTYFFRDKMCQYAPSERDTLKFVFIELEGKEKKRATILIGCNRECSNCLNEHDEIDIPHDVLALGEQPNIDFPLSDNVKVGAISRYLILDSNEVSFSQLNYGLQYYVHGGAIQGLGILPYSTIGCVPIMDAPWRSWQVKSEGDFNGDVTRRQGANCGGSQEANTREPWKSSAIENLNYVVNVSANAMFKTFFDHPEYGQLRVRLTGGYSYECHGKSYIDEKVCGGKGICVSEGKDGSCICVEGRFGKNCEYDRDIIIWVSSLSVGFFLVCCCCCCYCCCPCIIVIVIVILIVSGLILFGLGFGVILCLICVLGGGGCGTLILFFVGKKNGKDGEFDQFDLVEKQSRKENTAMIRIDHSLFEIDYDQLKVKRLIGEGGSNSSIFLCSWKSKDVAFKCFKTKNLMDEQENFDEFEKEVRILGSIRHPFTLNFFGATLKPPRVGIVMEYCSNGDLKNYLTANSECDIKTRIRWLHQISDAMEYLHERNVIHRDIKSENILLTNELVAKIIDFGLSKIVDRMSKQKTRSVGTSCYMAPEVILGEIYNEKCDVFSFSIVIWEVFANKFTPYKESSQFNIEYKIANDESMRPDIESISDHVKENFSSLVDIMIQSWKHDPTDRPSFSTIKESFERYLNDDDNDE